MAKDWTYLKKLTGGQEFTISRVSLAGSGISIDGEFDLPPLARLNAEDQVFVAAFVCSHGSIKQMEKQFGVSYPTIKSRLNRISRQLDFVEVSSASPAGETLDKLNRGEITADEAIRLISKGDNDVK